MSNFYYRAVSPQGKKLKGTVKADSDTGARRVLQKQNYTIISLDERKEKKFALGIFKRVSIKDKIIFTEQLGVMIKAGLSVTEALKSLESETQNKYFADAIKDIENQVEGGAALSDSMAKYPKIFPEVYVQIVKSGEVTGALDDVLNRLALQLEKDYELISKVKGAMIYPAIIFCLLVAVVILIITYIVPKLKDVFAEAGAQLPITTRILIAISDAALKYSYIFVIGFVALIVGFRYLTSRGQGQYIWHSVKMHIPVFGTFSKKIILARFTQTFGSLSGAGVPVLKIFETTQNVVGNEVIKRDIQNIAQDVKNGVPVSFAFRKCKNFPSMVAQLASIGEKSGEMQEVFLVLSNFYEKEVDNMAKNLSSALEPIIMIIMGLGVGFILMSVLQPMYGLVSTM